MHACNLAAPLLNLDLLLHALSPFPQVIESNNSITCWCYFLEFVVNNNWLDWRIPRADGVQFLANILWSRAHKTQHSWGETNNDPVVTIPFKWQSFTVRRVEVKHEMLGVFGLEVQHLFACNNWGAHTLGFVNVSVGAPLNFKDISFANKAFMQCVSLVVWDGEQLVFWSADQISLFTPVSILYPLSVLLDSGDSTLRLPVEKNQSSLFSSDCKHWVGFGPWNVSCFILVGGKLNILELSLTHRPDGDCSRTSKDGKWIIILIPGKFLNPRSVVAWKFKKRFSLSNSN